MIPVEVSSDFTQSWYTTAPVLVLDWYYDPNQYWLPFSEHYFVFQAWPEEAEPYEPPPKKNTEPVKNGFILPAPKHGQMNFDDPTFLQQYLMPFKRDYLRITNSQMKHYKFLLRKMKDEAVEAGVPFDPSTFSWELTKQGKFFMIDVRTGETNEDVTEWCSRTLKRRYNLSGKVLTFESAHDAIMAKLRFR